MDKTDELVAKMRPELRAHLTHSEARIAVKTVMRLNEEAARGRVYAVAYLDNLNATQRAVLQKVFAHAQANGGVTPREVEAFTNFGFEVLQ